MKYKLYIGSDEKPALLGEVEAGNYREACIALLGEDKAFNQTSLLYHGRMIYDNPEQANQDFVYSNTTL